MMIKMGDRDRKGGVNVEDFIDLMKEQLGLIPKEKKKNQALLEPGVNPEDVHGLKKSHPSGLNMSSKPENDSKLLKAN